MTDDLLTAPGANDLTFGSTLEWLIGQGFQRVQTLDGAAKRKHYTECKACGGTDEDRNHPRPSSLSVKHDSDCGFAKHLPRLRAMANEGVT